MEMAGANGARTFPISAHRCQRGRLTHSDGVPWKASRVSPKRSSRCSLFRAAHSNSACLRTLHHSASCSERTKLIKSRDRFAAACPKGFGRRVIVGVEVTSRVSSHRPRKPQVDPRASSRTDGGGPDVTSRFHVAGVPRYRADLKCLFGPDTLGHEQTKARSAPVRPRRRPGHFDCEHFRRGHTRRTANRSVGLYCSLPSPSSPGSAAPPVVTSGKMASCRSRSFGNVARTWPIKVSIKRAWSSRRATSSPNAVW